MKMSGREILDVSYHARPVRPGEPGRMPRLFAFAHRGPQNRFFWNVFRGARRFADRARTYGYRDPGHIHPSGSTREGPVNV
jgi:hypothetical protein